MGTLSGLSVLGGGVACCGLLFFLGCVALVVWYAVRGPKPKAAASSAEPVASPPAEAPKAAESAPESVTGGTHDADE